MTKINRKLFSFVLVVLMLALSACGGSGKNNEASSSPSADPAASEGSASPSASASDSGSSDKPVTLKMILWTNAPTVNAVKEINAAFTQKYPNIKVEVTDIVTANYAQTQQTRLTAKDVDIIANQAFVGAATDFAPKIEKPAWQKWIDAGLIEPLDGQPFLSNYYPDAVKNASTYNGKVYGVETGSVAFNGIYYNMDTFAKYGLKPPGTWSELINILKTLQDNKEMPLIMGGKDGWPPGLAAQGIFASIFPDAQEQVKKWWTGEAKFTDPDFVKVLQRTQELWSYAPKNYVGVGYDQAMAYFAQGKAAMLPDGTWRMTDIAKANPNLHFGYFAIPNDNAGENNFLGGKYDLQWMVTSFSKNKDAAMKWLDFFTQPENYGKFAQATGFLPTQPNIELNMTTQAGKDILELSKNFRLALDQAILGRKGVTSGQPGDVTGSWGLLKPQGKMDSAQLAEQTQKAFDTTAAQNK